MQSKTVKLEELNASKVCVVPWTNFVLGPDANFAICCEMVPSDIPTKVTTHQRLNRIHLTDPKVLRIKGQMLAGKEPTECNNCFSREQKGSRSARHYYNEKFFLYHDVFAFDDSPLTFLELRLGNLCQLECVMCNPTRSEKLDKLFSQLNGDGKSYGSFLAIKPISASWLDSEVLLDKLFELCKEVKVIYFNGGEPLLVKMHDQILNRLIEQDLAKDVKLAYSTNGLLLTKSHIDVWKKFKQVNVPISVDDIGERNRFIRYPTSWGKMVECLNLAKSSDAPHVNFSIWSTINILNFYYIDEIEGFFKENYQFNHQIRGIQEPRFLSPINIPQSIKEKIVNRLKTKITNQNVLNELDFILSTRGDDTLFYEGLEYLQKIAEKRNIDLAATFKEFYELIND